jgi:hypothetical protein
MLMPSKERCLDHNHKNGRIRGVLCRGCNSMEGKVHRAFIRVGLQNKGVLYPQFLINLSSYTHHKELKYIHPTFKVKK